MFFGISFSYSHQYQYIQKCYGIVRPVSTYIVDVPRPLSTLRGPFLISQRFPTFHLLIIIYTSQITYRQLFIMGLTSFMRCQHLYRLLHIPPPTNFPYTQFVFKSSLRDGSNVTRPSLSSVIFKVE